MTDSARRRRIDDICDAALELPAADRAAFVASACGEDTALRTEVEALLSHAEQADGFLEESLGTMAAGVIGSGREPLVAGRRLGPYEIVALIGAGGMGEVYRARDTKLGRDVAIKVIASTAPADADQLARFDREARILAALNHPRIGAIYGLEDVDGSRALVLELVEGKTLAERLAETRLSIAASLTIAREIAEALEAAHDKGVIHRDLKPANIKITPDGAVKILDFGLAKVFARDDLANSSRSTGLTYEDKEGVIAGTAGYMSPEQARGAAVNKRTDIWAFGCVLYEMLAGRPAFSGETRADISAWILERDPDWSALPTDTPATVRRLLHRCLERDATRRLRDIGDARIEIDEALSAPALTTAAPTRGAKQRRSGARRSPFLWWAAAVAIVVASAALAYWYGDRNDYFWRDPFEGAKYSELTDFIGAEHHAAISPNGQIVVFLSDRESRGTWHAWMLQIGAPDFYNLTLGSTMELRNPATRTLGFTPDSLMVLLWSRSTDLGLVDSGMAVPTMRGQMRPMMKMKERISELDFSPIDKRIVYHPPTDGDPIFVTEDGEGTGKEIKIYETKVGWHNHFLLWSPDAKFIYFVHGLPQEKSDVWRIIPSLDASPERITTHDSTVSFPMLLDNQTLLYLATDEEGLGPWIYSMDLGSRVAHRISRGVDAYTSLSLSGDSRSLVATKSQTTSRLWRLPITDGAVDASRASAMTLPTTNGASPRVGPGFITYRAPGAGLDRIWKMADDGTPSGLWNRVEGRVVSGAVPSTDGKRLAFVVRREGKQRLYVVNVDGSSAQLISGELDVLGAPAWHPDGRWVAAGAMSGEQPSLFKFPIDEVGAPVSLVSSYAVDPAWSPSGDFLVYTSEDVGTNFKVQAVNADATPKTIPLIRLARGARRLAFLSEHQLVFMKGNVSSRDFFLVDLLTESTQQLSKLGPAFDVQDFAISVDRREIIFDRRQEESDIVLIKLRKR